MSGLKADELLKTCTVLPVPAFFILFTIIQYLIMGRGRKPSRGGTRRFTDIETLKQQSREIDRRGVQKNDDEEESEEEEERTSRREINKRGAVGDLPPSESESESEDESPSKGQNLAAATNSLQQRNKKLNNLTLDSLEINDEKRGLNRKEREELARQEAKKKYQAMTAAGKTDEAKADLARLALIRAQREEAAKKRELEQKAKEAAAKAKADARKQAQSNKI
ncbi:28 kDa heat- and acid-stable phosphoprotein-like [Watersipora subatra]|uniref:28 kDa heat- and acid-stable phosphoprotein-like n=1 Tax=Watersipora subatra TaxID=2589382 RepID=UPI00355C3A96